MKDLIIIGAGPAGLSAALYAARKKMDFLIVAKDTGGQMALSSEVDNYLGIRNKSGYELSKLFTSHLKSYGVEITDGTVGKVERKGGNFLVEIDGEKEEARALIVATGKKSRKISAVGAEKFDGKGISYCATCDAPLFAGKIVAVAGGGNSALDAAIQLEKYASKIYLIARSNSLRGDAYMAEKVRSSGAEIIFNSEIIEFTGKSMLEGITLSEGKGKKKAIKLDGVFVEIGKESNAGIIDFVEKNEAGEIIVDCDCKTSAEGVFAAGDVSTGGAKQVISAAGEGASALASAHWYLNKKK